VKGVASIFAQQGADREGLFKIPVDSQTDPLNGLTEEMLSGYLNTKFQIITSGGDVELELIKVTKWEPRFSAKSADSENLDCFAALFRGPLRKPLQSGTYTVNHHPLGTFTLFVTPVNSHKNQRLYEIIFNRIRQ